MTDYQRIVDDLRNAVIAAGGDISAEAIESSLNEYRDACEKTNDRLRHCEGLLKKGLRSEAIQYAEIEPNLLDVVVMLDFPERDVVAKTLRQIGLRLPAVHAEVAGELNEAYAALQPLEALMSRHRFLALASAPLQDRLRVLRRIAEVDPTNAIWLEDIGVYEQERFKELHALSAQAAVARDLTTLDACHAELMYSAWRQMPPEAFKRTLTKARDNLRRSIAREQLTALEPDLNLAHAALDVTLGRTLRAQWQAAAATAQLAEDDPLLQKVAPALEWIEEQDRRDDNTAAFKEACAALERLLDIDTVRPSHRVQLESRYHAALRHEFDLPPQLEDRYRSRITAIDLMETRKTRLRMAAIVSSLLLAGGGIAYGIYAHSQNKKIADATAALAKLVEAGKTDPDAMANAEAFHRQLVEMRPDYAEVPAIQQLAGEVAIALQREKARKQRFDEALAAAKASGAEKPNRAALNEASELARVDAEKADVARFLSEVSAAARAMQIQRDKDFTAEVARLAEKVREVEAMGFDDLNILAIALNETQATLNATQAQYQDITQAAAAQLSPLSARIAALRATSDRLRVERTALQAVVSAVAERGTYLEALSRYINQHPASGRSSDFKQILAEAPKWMQLDEWNQAVQRIESIDGTNATADDIKFLKDAATKFERFPLANVLSTRGAHYERLAARRDAAGVSKITKLRSMFDNPLMKSAWMVRMRNGDTFYLLAEPERSAGVSQSLSIVQDYALTPKNIIVPTEDVREILPAPQVAMSAKVLSEMDRIKNGRETDWEPCFATIIRAIYDAGDVEPLLRLGLLKKVIETACQGSSHMNDALRIEMGLFENTEANLLVNWMDTKNVDAQLAARTARNELNNMPDLAVNAERASQAVKQSQIQTKALPRYELLGCLIREPSGWQCSRAGATATKNGGLFVMLPDAPEGLILRDIGKMLNGAPQLNISGGSELVEGRLVWIEPQP